MKTARVDDTALIGERRRVKPGGKPWGILPCERRGSALIISAMDRVSELNKLKVRLFVGAVINEGRLELIDELVTADYVGRLPCLRRVVRGPAGVRRMVSRRRSRYPDRYVWIDDQIAEDDRVAVRWRTPGYSGISIVRFLAGRQVESHTEYTNDSTPVSGNPV